MEKKEKRPGYFARLKKRRQLRQSQSEKAVAEESPLEPDSKGPIICAPAPAEQVQNNNPGGDQSSKSEAAMRGGPEDNRKSNGQAKKEKRRPPGTVEYTVGPEDTFNSIALKFNITPTTLVQLNRLFSRSVVPGQRLFVPDVGQSGAAGGSTGLGDQNPGQEPLGGKLSCRSGAGRQRALSPHSEDESPATVKFLKMSCKYFTDGMGVVGGVMIVTPNNIMFDPHKSDPLVIEHGCEEYGLICPMEEVLSVALYDDVSRMKLKDALPSPGEWVELPSERDLNPFSRYEALGRPSRPIILDDIEAADSDMAECHPAEKSPSDEGFTELELLQNDSSTENGMAETSVGRPETADTGCLEMGGSSSQDMSDCERVNVTGRSLSDQSVGGAGTCDLGREEEDEGLDSRVTNERAELAVDGEGPALQRDGTEAGREAHGVAVAEEVNETDDILNAGASHQVSASDATRHSGNCSSSGPSHKEETTMGPSLKKRQIEREEEKESEETEMKSWLMKRMQEPIEDMLLSTEEKSKNPPMFLCFKVGKPMRKSFASGRTSSPAHSFGARGNQPEYWFAVPQERVDHLYSFFIQCSPDAYGNDAQEQGFVVVEKDELNMIDNFFSDPVPRSWEIITINEAKRRQSLCSYEEDEALDTCVLTQPSSVLQDTHVEKLVARLPARLQGCPWRLVYSTVVHGTSLKTLYRNLGQLEGPVMLAIKNMEEQIYGAFSTHPFRVSEHYYGTGETLLYTFNPEIKVFRWTGENSYFVKGNLDSLQIGGGGGHLGLWLDADLYHGTTSSCSTFNNQPLSSQQDFTVQNLEVWAFE
ncbi:nuclear receptor coactivator 7b isoform X2 [Brachyhypopomus gauderio]|uniref:nuclear receptor coactivator 7b isoform X2 n=1 Tax=Brachyhypopomus gauderio TaxID=698409 RepID=UPI004041BB8F